MVLNELAEVLFWENIGEYIEFCEQNDAEFYEKDFDEYRKRYMQFIRDKIGTKENFTERIEYYNVHGKPVWQGDNKAPQNCDRMRRADVARALEYGGRGRWEEIVSRFDNSANTWMLHFGDYGGAVNRGRDSDILELSVGAGLGTYAVMKQLSPGSRMVCADIDFVCVRNADGLAKYFGVDDRVCGLNASFWSLPFDGGVFDTVCTHYGLDEAREVSAAGREAARVLKSGGRFVVIAREIPYARRKEIMEMFGITERECNPLLKKARLYSGPEDLAETASECGLALAGCKKYESETNSHYGVLCEFIRQ